jgi:hypothetical protein
LGRPTQRGYEPPDQIQRIKFSKAQERAKAGVDQANMDLAVIFQLLGIEDGLKTKNQGKFTWVAPGITKSFSKEVCKAQLSLKGVDIDVVNKAFDAATTESDKKGYIKWDKKKAKKGKK